MSQYPQLDESFKALLAQGVSPEKIKADALAIGWLEKDINASLAVATGTRVSLVPESPKFTPVPSEPVIQKTTKKAPREAVKKHSKLSQIILIIVLIFVLLVIGALGFAGYLAYSSGYTPFSKAPYVENTFASTLLSKLGTIKSGQSAIKISAQVVDREADAQPINLVDPDATSTKQKYDRDKTRIDNVSSILDKMKYSYDGGYTFTADSSGKFVPPDKVYPPTLGEVDPDNETDPSGIPYTYALTDDGKNFALQVTFETDAAIRSIQLFSSTSTTMVDGKTVTFTKDSSSFIFFSDTPPKSLLETLSELAGFLSPDFAVSGSLTAQKARSTVVGTSSLSNTSVELNGEGDLGDLTYHVNVETRSVDNQVYFRVNHFPSLLSLFLPPKGQWISLTATDTSSILPTVDLAAIEAKYLKKNQSVTSFHAVAAQIADSTGLLSFKHIPRLMLLDRKIRYEYDFSIKKEAVTGFLTQLVAEAQKDPVILEQYPFLNEDTIQYVQSPLFSELFDYYVSNTNMKIVTTPQGDPVKLVYSLRVVPPESNTNMKGKELLITIESSFENINGDVVIQKPDGAKTLQEVMKDSVYGKALIETRDAAVQASVNNVRAEMEIFGSKTDGSVDYTGACSDATVARITDDITNRTSAPYCYASATAWVYEAPLNSGYACVDSTGASKVTANAQLTASGISCN